MVPEAANIPDDLEQLRRRLEEFRKAQPGHSRLPESLWVAATELAKRYGVNPTARALRLEHAALRKRVENQGQPRAQRKMAAPATFMEFVAPGAQAVTNCTVEVQSAQGGKLRLELKSVATTELVNLIRAFVSQ
jgi:hypothetical protein